MRFKHINDAFREQWNVLPIDYEDSDKGLLDKLLSDVIKSLGSSTDWDKYANEFQNCIENVFPDEPWYENVGIDIKVDLFNTQNPELTKQHILDSIIEGSAYTVDTEVIDESFDNPGEVVYKGYIIKDSSKDGRAVILDKNFKVIRTDIGSEEEGREYIDSITESKEKRTPDIIEKMDAIDVAYGIILDDYISNLLLKNNASNDDSSFEGYFSTMSNQDIENVYAQLRKYVINKLADEEIYKKEDIDDLKDVFKITKKVIYESKKNLKESLEIKQEVDFNYLLDKCWGQAVTNLEEIENAGLEDKLMSFLEEYSKGSPINLTKLNDLLAYDWEYVFEAIGMSTEEDEDSLTEDTIKKSNGKWTNRGDDGEEHGEFKTKKEADAQRKAMYANGYKGESMKESANPENAEINKIIYDVATGKSKAIQKLKKLGYEVEIDDTARKEFGRKYFGDTIRITNPETGNSIVGNTGTSEYGYVSGDFLRANSKYGKSHTLKPSRYNKEVTADEKDFDYKTFLDKKHNEPLSKETTISQFKKDKKLINDNQNLYKQLKDADNRLSSIRSKIKSRNGMSESKFNEPTSIGKGYAAPITTDLRRHRIKDDLEYINDENPSYSRVARNDLVRAYNEILSDIEEVEEFDAYWAEHKKALMREFKAQLDLIPKDIRD